MRISSRQTMFLTLAGLVLLFFGPLAAAVGFYHYGLPWETKTIQHGNLFKSPITLSDLSMTNTKGERKTFQDLKGRWLLFYRNLSFCGKVCEGQVNMLSRVHRALGENSDRVIQVSLALNDVSVPERKCLPKADIFISPGVESFYFNPKQQIAWEQRTAILPAKDRIFVVDPHGNLILSYGPEVHPKFILKDLKHLLRISNIG